MQSPATFFNAPQEAVVIQEVGHANVNADNNIADAGEAVPVVFPSAENNTSGLRYPPQ